MFDPDFDPLRDLTEARYNIQQLIIAVTAFDNKITQLESAQRHQQEVIQQLMFQNQKLNQLLAQQKLELARQNTELTILKSD